MTIREAYDPAAPERWQPLSDGAVVGVAIAAIGGDAPRDGRSALLFAVALGAAVIGVDGRPRSQGVASGRSDRARLRRVGAVAPTPSGTGSLPTPSASSTDGSA